MSLDSHALLIFREMVTINSLTNTGANEMGK